MKHSELINETREWLTSMCEEKKAAPKKKTTSPPPKKGSRTWKKILKTYTGPPVKVKIDNRTAQEKLDDDFKAKDRAGYYDKPSKG